jgi:pilus assembly protein CpaB
MNTARIVVLTIAVGAGGGAAYPANGSDSKPPPAAPVARLQTIDVLVAKSVIGPGQTVTSNDIQWQSWQTAAASNTFIRRNGRPYATTQIAGSLTRAPFIAGEPIREAKLARADGSGFTAAIPPTGMRAVPTEISPETGAGGFRSDQSDARDQKDLTL